MAQYDSPSEVLNKFRLDESDLNLIRVVGPRVMTEIDQHLDDFYSWLS